MLPRKQSAPADDIFTKETHIKILDLLEKRPFGIEIEGLTSPSLYLVNARLNDESLSNGDKIELPSDKIGLINEIKYKDITTTSQSELVEGIMEEINSNPDNHISFYNRANNISLKVHSFQLLPSVGKSKAQQMVQARGMIGWENFSDIDGKCSIESVRLLAERYAAEMKDSDETPRLLDLLLRNGM
jgi:predicted nucleic acid-binding OB-fold protein